jgi:probable rRNA maturation factor
VEKELRRINIHNAHPKFRVKKTALRLLVKNILSSENADSGVDIIFVGDNLMKKLNRQFTGRNGTTDVLSFGMREGQPSPVDYPNLGDVYVCLDQAKKQAEDRKAGLDEEVALLVAHGVLHLLGYDHEDKNQKAVMHDKQQTYLKKPKKVMTAG